MGETPRNRFFRRYGFRTPVRGHAFAAPPHEARDSLTPGVPLTLVREPNNPRDPYAIAVWTATDTASTTPTWRIGYLDQLVAARLAPQLDDGVTIAATFDGWVTEPLGRWQRPLIRLSIEPDGTDGRADSELTVEADPDRYTAPSRLQQLGPGVRRRRVPRR